MTIKQGIFFLAMVWCVGTAKAQRSWHLLDTGWAFHFSYDVRQDAPKQKITLPHTWNVQEAVEGKMDYTRTEAIYEKHLDLTTIAKNRRLFLFFDGVNSYAQVLVNNHFVGEHKGGYTKFCLEITSFVNWDTVNQIKVIVSNTSRPDILPQTGDFNVFGGIHRPVYLLETSADCISPLDYASSGVYATPVLNQNADHADVAVKSILSVHSDHALTVQTTIKDAARQAVASVKETVDAARQSLAQTLSMDHPHLWDAVRSPYLYSVDVQLLDGDRVVDQVEQPLGLRQYKVEPNEGLVLNGKYLDLHGFGLHEDFQGKGSAVSRQDLRKDMQLVKEAGATSLRLTHYPHSQYVYDYADSSGIVLWSEIPLVGPGGYTGYGYVKNPALEAQAVQVLTEMVLQNYNHPSVLFWGLFNELKLDHDNPIPFIVRLDSLCKSLDQTRLTTCATFLDNDKFNKVSDVIAWNKYYGWYGGKFSDIGKWADWAHNAYPTKAFAVSEYGAGASIQDHNDGVKAPDPSGRFHPEEWQTAYHEAHWQELKKRPFVWGKYVWDLADFASSIRTEGERLGINDKGLVTYDRKVKKDAFYFYKANWSNAPMVYIAERRYVKRKTQNVRIKVFANVDNVRLYVNGKLVGTKNPDDNKTLLWENVTLRKGSNHIAVEVNNGPKTLRDSCDWVY
ncbi:MAG: glycoside hydrolase family 2 TIM barrel-domain containing protein [Chitinophagaceae bacterium]